MTKQSAAEAQRRIIMELRKQGFEIVTEWALEYCPGGVRHRVARYRLRAGER